jgi:indole-3-glycerol phosphate synthase
VSDTLGRICAEKRCLIAERRSRRSAAEVEAAARTAPPPRGFLAALRGVAAKGRPALICEIKKASPSKGLIRADFDPQSLARAYAQGGAACLSVLTDTPYFQGRDADLVAARRAVELPVLRKDFMLEPYQIFESRALGADCILIIMAALDDGEARVLLETATALAMDALIEVHDEAELTRALRLEAPLIGINNRDLKSLRVDLATTERLAPLLPAERFLVGESGIAGGRDIARLQAVGAKAFLIGESLMRQDDVAAATRALAAPAMAD